MILYNVNKDKRVISARFSGMEEAVENTLIGTFSDLDDYAIVRDVINKFYENGRLRMIGLSFCHEDDEWNETIGKELAKRRLLRQYYVLLHEILIELKKEFNKEHTYKMNKINSKINKYLENSKKFKSSWQKINNKE